MGIGRGGVRWHKPAIASASQKRFWVMSHSLPPVSKGLITQTTTRASYDPATSMPYGIFYSINFIPFLSFSQARLWVGRLDTRVGHTPTPSLPRRQKVTQHPYVGRRTRPRIIVEGGT
jgi:hypothetical protein